MVTLSDLEANDLANEIIDKDLSVRETEKLVGKIKKSLVHQKMAINQELKMKGILILYY